METISLNAPVGAKSAHTTMGVKAFVRVEKFKYDTVLNNLGISFNLAQHTTAEGGAFELVPAPLYGGGKQTVGDIVLMVTRFDGKGPWTLIINNPEVIKATAFKSVIELLEQELKVVLAGWIYGREYDQPYDISAIYTGLAEALREGLKANRTRWEKRFGIKLDDALVANAASAPGRFKWAAKFVTVEDLLNKFGAMSHNEFSFSDGMAKRKATPFLKLGFSVAEALSRRPSWAKFVLRVQPNGVSTFKLVSPEKEGETVKFKRPPTVSPVVVESDKQNDTISSSVEDGTPVV